MKVPRGLFWSRTRLTQGSFNCSPPLWPWEEWCFPSARVMAEGNYAASDRGRLTLASGDDVMSMFKARKNLFFVLMTIILSVIVALVTYLLVRKPSK